MAKEIEDLFPKVIEEVEKNLLGYEQEQPVKESKSSAIEAYLNNVEKLHPYEVQKGIEDIDKVKERLSKQQERIKSLSTRLKDIDNVKEILSELQKKIGSVLTRLKDKPPHQPLLLDKKKLQPILENFEVSYCKLNSQLRISLLYLSIFPEIEVIKKRPIIY